MVGKGRELKDDLAGTPSTRAGSSGCSHTHTVPTTILAVWGVYLGWPENFFSVNGGQEWWPILLAASIFSFLFWYGSLIHCQEDPCPSTRITLPWTYIPPTQNPGFNYQAGKALQRASKAHPCWAQLWIWCCLGLFSTVIPTINFLPQFSNDSSKNYWDIFWPGMSQGMITLWAHLLTGKEQHHIAEHEADIV